MVVNCLNNKRGSGKSIACVEQCIQGVFEGKKVLLLVMNCSEIKRIKEVFTKFGYDEHHKIDIFSFCGDFMYKIKGKRYDLIVIDECFEMRLDAQANFIEYMYSVNPSCVIFGIGTEVRRKTFRDYTITKDW